MLVDNYHGSSLFHCDLGFLPLTLETKQGEEAKELGKKNNELGLLVARCSWFNPEIQNRTISYHDI